MASITSLGCGGLDNELDRGEIILSRRLDEVVKWHNKIKDIPLVLKEHGSGEVFLNQQYYSEDREDLFEKLKIRYLW